ncbi:MAG: hypothetical protein HOV92_00575 [Streptomyces sp.]|nr:hypothetical protein [Streptomyces sp.]
MTTDSTAPAADRLFALISSIPGSASMDWCDTARALLDEVRSEATPDPRTFEDGGVNDIRALYALQHAIEAAGGELTRPVHKAIDALRGVWDDELRRAQSAAAPVASAVAAPATDTAAVSEPWTADDRLKPHAIPAATTPDVPSMTGGFDDSIEIPEVAAVLPADSGRADTQAPAATCSAQNRNYESGPRLCIRAAQHHGDHIDERGYHWSDTVAVYPLADGTFRTGINLRAELRRMAAEPAPVCAECGHPKDAHTEGEDPVSPGRCGACAPDGEDWHNYEPAAVPAVTHEAEAGSEGVTANSRPTRYTVSLIPEDADPGGTYAITVEYRGDDRWAVLRHSLCLSSDGRWDRERVSSEREEEWLDEHRFDLPTALRLAEEQATDIAPPKWRGRDSEPRLAHVGGNAEDCPACHGTNPDYPFVCPGPGGGPS